MEAADLGFTDFFLSMVYAAFPFTLKAIMSELCHSYSWLQEPYTFEAVGFFYVEEVE